MSQLNLVELAHHHRARHSSYPYSWQRQTRDAMIMRSHFPRDNTRHWLCDGSDRTVTGKRLYKVNVYDAEMLTNNTRRYVFFAKELIDAWDILDDYGIETDNRWVDFMEYRDRHDNDPVVTRELG